MPGDARPNLTRRRPLVLLALIALVTGLLPAVGVAAAETARGTSNICAPPYESSFDDIAGSAHEGNVLCMADLGITEGTGDGASYSPRREVTRAQMASFIARYIEHYTGDALPLGAARFGDVPAAFVHHDNIHKLRTAGVTEGTAVSGGTSFAPQQLVTRAQMASFISRASSYIEDGQAMPEHQPPRSSTDRFPDDANSVHEANIDALAAVGIVEGFVDGTYRPANPVFRDQMASFVMRAYDWAVTVGLGGEVVDPDPERGVVTGTVTDAGDGAPIAGATVTIANGDDHAVTTAGDGTYTVADVDAGTYTATVAAESYLAVSREVEVEAGETVTVDFQLAAVPDQFDDEITVQLNWQNQYREAEQAFGGVDDYAAFHLDDDGAGELTLRWDSDAGIVEVEGRTTLTARVADDGANVHAGGLEEEGAVAIALPAPTFVGDAADAPGAGEQDRGLYTYAIDGTVTADVDTLAALEAALEAGGPVGWYVNVATVRNPAGEVRGQLGDADGGLDAIVPQLKLFEFHELGTGTNTGEAQTSFNLWFDADIAYAGDTGQTRPGPDDFVLTINGEEHQILRVRGDNPDWQPYPKSDVRIHLDTHEVVEDGDVAEITLLDSGAAKLLPVGRHGSADDLSSSWRTRCTRIISVDAMTSEPCGTPPQPGLSDFAATPIDSAPNQTQEFSVTIAEPGIPAGEELWIDLIDVSHDGLVDYSDSTWTATVDGEVVGTAAFWELEIEERFETVWEPFLVLRHDDDVPIAGELILSGADIDGSDAAVLGETPGYDEYDTYAVRHDTGRADYTEIRVNYVPQPTITLEPADAVVLAEAGAAHSVTATYTDVDGVPVDGADIRFWVEQGERPNIEEKELGTGTTDAAGQATITHEYDGRDVEVGAPLIDTLRAELVVDRFVSGRATIAWATGVATNEGPGEAAGSTYHDLNDAVAGAAEGDTITAEGDLSSVYGLPRGDRVEVRTADLTIRADAAGASLQGAFDLRADGVTVTGFDVQHAGGMQYAFRVEGAGIAIVDNVIDAGGADGIRVRDAWGPVAGGGSAMIVDNQISRAAIAIDVDNRDQTGELVTDLTIEGNRLADNEIGLHYAADGGTATVTGNEFVAGDTGNIYVRDATAGEVLDLDGVLGANAYDPAGEILGRSIVPIDPDHTPSMVRVVEHGTGQGDQYTVVEYTRGVACDGGSATAAQFTLDRGTESTPNRTGAAVDCGYGPNQILITWDGNPSFPNEVRYEQHPQAQYRVHNEHDPDAHAVSPDVVGSPFPKADDGVAVSGAVYLTTGGFAIDGLSYPQGAAVTDVDLAVRISDRSEPANLSLWFDGARPGEGFTAGEDICAELLTEASCTLLSEALAGNDPFTGDTTFVEGATVELAEDAAPGVWQLRWWVVDSDDGEVYFADTITITIDEPSSG